jgi:riboflavin kinase/FMN adenylyltransferase
VQIHYNIENFRPGNSIVTVGVFDGVHRGHKYIINRLIEISRMKGGESVILTLWPHPRHVLNHDPSVTRLITTLDEKIEILSGFDAKHLLVLNFDHEFSRMSAIEFIENILVKKIGVKHLVVGHNHRFGNDREGNIHRLKEFATRYHFTVEQLKPYRNGNKVISSSVIRDALMCGDINTANDLLGHRFFISGRVVGGTQTGKSNGFPTAKIK